MNNEDKNNPRSQFLLNYYSLLWKSINIRINFAWESMAILVGAFAIFALTERNVLSLDIAVTLVILICGWFLSHVIDTSFWFERNLVIIRNIEKEFLNVEDAVLIMPYFLRHKGTLEFPQMFKIQAGLGIGLGIVVLLYHLFKEVLPSATYHLKDLSFPPMLPYLITLFVTVWLIYLWISLKSEFLKFVKTAPGKDIASDIEASNMKELLKVIGQWPT